MSDLNVGFGRAFLADDEKLTFGDDDDYSIRYDSGSDTLVIADEKNRATALEAIRNGDVRLGRDLLATDGEVIWDESAGYVPASSVESSAVYTDEKAQDAAAAALTGGSHATATYDDANNTITVDVADDWVDIGGDTMTGALDVPTLTVGGSTVAQSVPVSGQVSLSSGAAVIDTGLSATDATFLLALGVDDPNADTKLSGRLFWDDSAGTYKIEIVETETSVGNPTANYDVVRVR